MIFLGYEQFGLELEATAFTVIIALSLALVYVLWKYLRLLGKIEARAREISEKWSAEEMERHAKLLFEEWRQKEAKKIREEAI